MKKKLLRISSEIQKQIKRIRFYRGNEFTILIDHALSSAEQLNILEEIVNKYGHCDLRAVSRIDENGNYTHDEIEVLIKNRDKSSRNNLISKKSAIFVIDLLCAPSQREGVIGDIWEQYENVKKSQGERKAEIWFCTQIIWTALSLLRQRFRSIPGIALALVAFNWVYGKLAGG